MIYRIFKRPTPAPPLIPASSAAMRSRQNRSKLVNKKLEEIAAEVQRATDDGETDIVYFSFCDAATRVEVIKCLEASGYQVCEVKDETSYGPGLQISWDSLPTIEPPLPRKTDYP